MNRRVKPRNPTGTSPYLRKCHAHPSKKRPSRQKVKAALRKTPERFPLLVG